MGRMKNFALEIDENDTIDSMAFNLGISVEELKLLTYKANNVGNGFTRDVIFDLEKCPKEILAKIKNLENGNKVNYWLIDPKDLKRISCK
jgi:hypothetical protein